ncbi:pentapeptide repeat-containing protein [Marivibrio halodurans]|uniref:Pentapeptide repeat-containing protein n=1 Tax=Marivibrio halodurans TaxID=2039722 RepID=A0A8J7S9X9_9PROT|nr:pentapeptide repeat-containing protein [Marivibrio halodurans]MBP5858157.1 pentapeptide repeat-containing protein [Marivibrio halodurans]
MSDEIPPGLRDARTTPHYILATLAGEQDPDADEIDWDLHDRNRALWNRWATSHLDGDALQALIDEGAIAAENIADRSLDPIKEAAKARGLDALPTPDEEIDWGISFWRRNSTAFSDFYFFGPVTFEDSTSKGDANFYSAIFKGEAFFKSATFKGDADFYSAIFKNEAFFKSATFKGDADFYSATFKGDAFFNSATFKDDARFNSATFESAVGFNSAAFVMHADFTNTCFRGLTNFQGALFRSNVPEYFGASLHEGTVFHDAIWPEVPRRDGPAARRQADAYERLKLEMDRLNRHEAELDFFARELMARRWCVPWHRAWLIAAYGMVSDHGRSLFWPLWTGFVLWFAGALGYAMLDPARWDEHEAMGFSAASLGAILGTRREVFPEAMHHAEWPVAILSTGQGIAGAVLIFLIGLALRNRFRIR